MVIPKNNLHDHTHKQNFKLLSSISPALVVRTGRGRGRLGEPLTGLSLRSKGLTGEMMVKN